MPLDFNAPPFNPSYNQANISSFDPLLLSLSLPKPDLEIFSGDLSLFRPFITSFDARIGCKPLPDHDKLYFLHQYLRGEPRDLISGCFHVSSAGYAEARRLLEKEYGDPYKLSMVYVAQISDWPLVKPEDPIALKRFSNFLVRCFNAMRGINQTHLFEHPSTLLSIVKKLPVFLQNKWREVAHRSSHDTRGLFTQLVAFIADATDVANDPIFGKPAARHLPKSTAKLTNLSAEIKTSDPACAYCESMHDTDGCATFNALTVNQKREFLKEKRLCFACYGAGHMSRGCSARRQCSICGRLHPTALHVDGSVPRSPNFSRSGTTVCSVDANQSQTVHTIIPVLISQEGCTAVRATYCLYDSGSSGCFMTSRLCEEMGLATTDTRLKLRTMHGASVDISKAIDGLSVSDLNGNNIIPLPRSFTQKEIPVDRHSVPKVDIIQRYECMAQVIENFPRPLSDCVEVDLLIGANCPQALEPLQAVSAGDCPLVAVKLRHGWTFYGALNGSSSDIVCHRVKALETHSEALTPNSLMSMFEQEFNECLSRPDERSLSVEDKRFLKFIEDNISLEDNHHVIPLPFKKAKPALPNNRRQAHQRLMWQKKKMQRNAAYHADYVQFMNNLVDKGYCEKVDESMVPEDGRLWYLPHHGVYNPNKPGKLRRRKGRQR